MTFDLPKKGPNLKRHFVFSNQYRPTDPKISQSFALQRKAPNIHKRHRYEEVMTRSNASFANVFTSERSGLTSRGLQVINQAAVTLFPAAPVNHSKGQVSRRRWSHVSCWMDYKTKQTSPAGESKLLAFPTSATVCVCGLHLSAQPDCSEIWFWHSRMKNCTNFDKRPEEANLRVKRLCS